MGYIDLAIILRNYFTDPYEMQNCISVDNGRLVIQQMNKVVKAKHIENIDSWTDAFLNYAKILVENHITNITHVPNFFLGVLTNKNV
jgi:hypothetical protein